MRAFKSFQVSRTTRQLQAVAGASANITVLCGRPVEALDNLKESDGTEQGFAVLLSHTLGAFKAY